MDTSLHVIWFKQDLRVHDHAALKAGWHASKMDGRPTLPLYINEQKPSGQRHSAQPQQTFLSDSLLDLSNALQTRGAELHLAYGPAERVFADVHRQYGLASIHTYDDASLATENPIKAWCYRAGVSLRPQARLQPKDLGAARPTAPDTLASARLPDLIANRAALEAKHQATYPRRQKGGRAAGLEALQTFCAAPEAKGAFKTFKPGDDLWLHLNYGTLSLREVWQAAFKALRRHKDQQDETAVSALVRFLTRLETSLQEGGKAPPKTGQLRLDLGDFSPNGAFL